MYEQWQLFLALVAGILLGTALGYYLRRQDDRIIIRTQSHTIQTQQRTIQSFKETIALHNIVIEMQSKTAEDYEKAIKEAEEYIRWLHAQVSKYVPKEEEGGETP